MYYILSENEIFRKYPRRENRYTPRKAVRGRSGVAPWTGHFQLRGVYTGVTGNIEQRIAQHKEGLTKGFASRYNLNKLVYLETFDYVHDAMAREKQIKAG